MAAYQAKFEEVVGKFSAKCGRHIEFSNERRVARGKGRNAVHNVAFSNDQIPIGFQFSVKILQQSSDYVSPISTSSRPHTSDAPHTAGAAVHVVRWCLFFVYCDGVEGTSCGSHKELETVLK